TKGCGVCPSRSIYSPVRSMFAKQVQGLCRWNSLVAMRNNYTLPCKWEWHKTCQTFDLSGLSGKRTLLGGHVTAGGEFAFHSADQGFHVGGLDKIVVDLVMDSLYGRFKSRIASEQDGDAFWIRGTHRVHDGESIAFFADVEIGK